MERNARLELRLVKKEEERLSTAVQYSYAINRVAEDRSIRSNLWHFDGDSSILNVPHRDLLGDDRLYPRERSMKKSRASNDCFTPTFHIRADNMYIYIYVCIKRINNTQRGTTKNATEGSKIKKKEMFYCTFYCAVSRYGNYLLFDSMRLESATFLVKRVIYSGTVQATNL